MKAVGIILLVLGLAGLGGGFYGMTKEKEAQQTIESKQKLLRDTFPGLEQEAGVDYNDIEDLVAVDRELKDNFMVPADVRDAAWDILGAMGDEEEMAMAKKGGFGAGGALSLIGVVLLVLGLRKKSGAVA